MGEYRLFAKSPCLFGRGWGFQPQAVIGESCPNHLFKRTDFWQTVYLTEFTSRVSRFVPTVSRVMVREGIELGRVCPIAQ
jgi:hypothetical protein